MTAPASAVEAAWRDYNDGRRLRAMVEVSANVSTNRVYRLTLDDASHVIAKASSYGSYFLFAEDHDRLHACARRLQHTRFSGMLADVLTKFGRVYTWYDGSIWVVFYEEVSQVGMLPRILTATHIECFAEEIAHFHVACAKLAPTIPLTSKSIKSDAITLLDQLTDPSATGHFQLPAEHIETFRRHTHSFLMNLEAFRYDYWEKIPVLIDWNLGNFAVAEAPNGRFTIISRWDYDWFRIDTRLLDFYFLSRVSSRTGDRTAFTYSPHTLLEPRFIQFLRAYHQIFPLSDTAIAFLPEVYRFFILNYVVREGARFFQPALCRRFRVDAATRYLPMLDTFDISPLRDILG
jgi:hypothetical protein